MTLTQFWVDSKIWVDSRLAGNLQKKLPKPPNKFTLNNPFSITKALFQVILLMKTILTIFKNTKVSKAAALDNLSGCFLKDDAKVLDKPITDLCNLSITSGKFPGSCKYVKLKPIYKKGSLTEASNYRPISLLPLISKVIEKVIHDQIAHFSTLEIYYTFLNLVFAKSFH